jgi:hypothetical protein
MPRAIERRQVATGDVSTARRRRRLCATVGELKVGHTLSRSEGDAARGTLSMGPGLRVHE